MSADYSLGEMERVQAGMIRVGVVAEVDAPRGLAKMKVAGLLTDWLPWGVARAGKTRTASAPTVGEQRLMFSPYGDTTQAIIGQAIYQEAHPTPSDSADKEVTVFPDGTRVEYNSATNTLQVDVAGAANVIVNCKVAIVKAATSVTLDTPKTICTGSLSVLGASLTHQGTNVGNTHAHGGIDPGPGRTGGPS